MYTQTNGLPGKNCITGVYTGSLAFMVPELIAGQLSVGTDELKTVEVWAVSMTLFAIINPDQSYLFQSDLKSSPIK